MSDRLDVFACGRSTDDDRTRNGRRVPGVLDRMLRDDELSPPLSRYLDDLDARLELDELTAKAEELTAFFGVLTAMHDDAARRRIPWLDAGAIAVRP